MHEVVGLADVDVDRRALDVLLQLGDAALQVAGEMGVLDEPTLPMADVRPLTSAAMSTVPVMWSDFTPPTSSVPSSFASLMIEPGLPNAAMIPWASILLVPPVVVVPVPPLDDDSALAGSVYHLPFSSSHA